MNDLSRWDPFRELEDMQRFDIQQHLRGSAVVCAAGNMPRELLRLWRPEDPKAYHLEYGFSCMGYEIPGCIGVGRTQSQRSS
jgi:TPP-dependent trihydroxycyclohexane-1,2-dione (THcHDO) dehydratase